MGEAEGRLINQFPYEVHQVRSPNGDLVWVQKGINPDNIFGDKRRSDWPFSQIIADLICQKIMEGESLSAICKQEGFPSYSVVCRWRNEQPRFKDDLEQAYKDRAEYYLEKVLEIAGAIEPNESARKARIKLDAYKWCAGIAAPEEKPSRQQGPLLEIVVSTADSNSI
ncbi:terminase small subunit-like protein [Bdellovibrio sp. BCCA]|uniref:terminase small subunit-like protein n=1 Tax=Bdellovibrio sp. BCCA TaxID=3136281 RepID=UPI0030F368CD